MATIRQVPAVVSEPPFKAMLPFDHRILYFDHEPFIPDCLESIGGSSGSTGSTADPVYGELAIYDSTGTTIINVLDLGDIAVGAVAYKTCLLKNIGTGPLTVSGLNTTGGYLIDPGIATPFVLLPGQTQAVQIGINVVS